MLHRGACTSCTLDSWLSMNLNFWLQNPRILSADLIHYCAKVTFFSFSEVTKVHICENQTFVMTKDNSSGFFTATPVAFVFVLFQDTIKSNFRCNKTHCFSSGGCKNRVKSTVFWTFMEFFFVQLKTRLWRLERWEAVCSNSLETGYMGLLQLMRTSQASYHSDKVFFSPLTFTRVDGLLQCEIRYSSPLKFNGDHLQVQCAPAPVDG